MKDVMIIPFFNEQRRFDSNFIRSNLLCINIDIIFVDDGSTDTTSDYLSHIINEVTILNPTISIFSLALEKNSGKSNAIRLGLIQAQSLGYEFALVQDFDFPYILNDGLKAITFAKSNKCAITSGARVMLAGSDINRFRSRQWIGRIIATILSFILPISFYDLQSPCKVYNLKKINPFIQKRFRTKWFHDAELLLRIRENVDLTVSEFALTFWADAPKSSLKFHSSFGILKEITFLLLISYKYSFRKFASKFGF